ncbi:orotate phosphoribosyltransferase [Ornithinibacillus scapharcae]|uniref:orotate phosphoribosyltransferase n=1 Tax=Ornithinibacillus scapharcae TaxID=1147159 RepID=UPI000225BE19|nr:orotate phosphoribosyltransferase [Ornithinibacillus scapharcae]
MNLSQKLARELLRINAVQINPKNYFTWASGIKSPIYCDNRVIISYPEVRSLVANSFVEIIKQMEIQPEIIAGCATAGIPHAAWVSDRLNLPMVYVRSKPKDHGTGSLIEGGSIKGKKVIVIEDLISTGGSSLNVVTAIRNAGAEVLQVMSIFNYGLGKAETNFKANNVRFESLTNYDELIQALVMDGKLTSEEEDSLLEWRKTI